MHRRALLKGLLTVSVPAAAAAAATAAARTTTTVRETTDASIEALRAQIDDLKRRLDRSDAKTRKLMKAAIALAALSLGLDVTAIL